MGWVSLAKGFSQILRTLFPVAQLQVVDWRLRAALLHRVHCDTFINDRREISP
jgi:hypothetical protein